ncbi:ABC transporter substrate-binding protein [Paenibacillus baekrokdamisoli]|uniref:ABC transporter substrate-binding protein n=1 Tax=Paenibacillus baekrokdamisoli TaxID=1712516 RepID=A0A3G9J0Z4_9BACL|nr:extracellular solute-binding protein [Paenibacillus baekrokdamisoli]MBB3072868.1 multiple sugar transport system substrate-binding protein [Paenibacillus baekrokdamisoli]BBH24426.1 ABC transporter substrate-binding protein [Paenibacillus baekrokdamisoli]
MNKNMKSLVVLMCMVLLLTACGSNGNSSSGETESAKPNKGITLTAITPPGMEDYYNARSKAFEEKTGVKVNIEVVAWNDIITKLTNDAVAGSDTYDIIGIDDIYLAKFADAGWIVPVDQYMTKELKGDLMDYANRFIQYKGKTYGLPWYTAWKTFGYNKDMLKKIGVDHAPQTWDEFIQLSQKLQKDGIVPYASAWSWGRMEAVICDFVAIMGSMGAEPFENGKPNFNNEKGLEALQLMYDMIYKYKIVDPASIQFGESDVNSAFAAGQTAFQFQWGIPLMDLNKPENSQVVNMTDLSLFPSKVSSASTIGSFVQAISKGSKNPKEAWDFIQFLNGPEGQKDMILKTGGTDKFTAWKSVSEDPEIKKNLPGFEVAMKQADTALARPQLPWYQEWSAMMQDHIQMALLKSKTPQEALQEADQETQKIMEKYNK